MALSDEQSTLRKKFACIKRILGLFWIKNVTVINVILDVEYSESNVFGIYLCCGSNSGTRA